LRHAIDKQTTPGNAFELCAHAFRDTLTATILDGCDDLQPPKARLVESEPDDGAHRFGGEAVAGARRSHPISNTPTLGPPVDGIYPDAPNQTTGRAIEAEERVFFIVLPGGRSRARPALTLRVRVFRMTPPEPALQVRERFDLRFEDIIDVLTIAGPQDQPFGDEL
jgi:hypothetical protein